MNNSPQQVCTSFVRTARIRWRDTDATGFAHFGVYVRLMEETEYAFLRSRGLSVILHDNRGTMGFPRLSTRLEIHRPVRFDESVRTQLSLVEVDGKQIVYDFEILDDQSDLVANGRFRVACCRFPNDQLPYAILTPEFVIQAMTAYEDRDDEKSGTNQTEDESGS